jgi:hypothetical protein
MALIRIGIAPKNVTKGLDLLRQMKSLTHVTISEEVTLPPAEFWKKYDAGEFGKPIAPAKLAYLDPAFQQWVKATQALPAEKQVRRQGAAVLDRPRDRHLAGASVGGIEVSWLPWHPRQ